MILEVNQNKKVRLAFNCDYCMNLGMVKISNRPPNSKNVYCSRTCRSIAYRNPILTLTYYHCKNKFLRNVSRKFCSKECYAQYRIGKPHNFDKSFYDSEEYKMKLSKKSSNRTVSLATREKISIGSRAYYADENNRRRHSEIMQQVVQNNIDVYNNISGRVKNYAYRDGITLKGTWEVTVAEVLDLLGIKWTRPNKGIPYLWNGSMHLYYPDFYLVKEKIFIEVKGYERERDRAKWTAVDNIFVIRQKEIDDLRSGNFDCLNQFL